MALRCKKSSIQLIRSPLEGHRVKALLVTIRPQSAFGTPMAGDTLFGHLCWALSFRKGATAFERIMDGYTDGNPFAVVSDAFPSGYLPRASLPDALMGSDHLDPSARKALKRRQWLPREGLGLPYSEWLRQSCSAWPGKVATVTQNTIHRITGTTGSGVFAPRQVEQMTFARETLLDIHLVLDTHKLTLADILEALSDIGQSGFGRDASTGLGKFEVVSAVERNDAPNDSTDFMTLPPCAPDVSKLDASRCWALPMTRFGRHGSVLAASGKPFKRPIMLARTGAVLRLLSGPALFHGVGLGGQDAPISIAMPATVHQGFAPILPILLDATP